MNKLILACLFSVFSFYSYANNELYTQQNKSNYPGVPKDKLCFRMIYPIPGMTHEEWVRRFCD